MRARAHVRACVRVRVRVRVRACVRACVLRERESAAPQVGAAGARRGEELTYCYGADRGPVGLVTGYGFRPAVDG